MTLDMSFDKIKYLLIQQIPLLTWQCFRDAFSCIVDIYTEDFWSTYSIKAVKIPDQNIARYQYYFNYFSSNKSHK